jgi:YidC/Oxa1 family membrane protein insertase
VSILNPLFEAVAWVMMQIHAGLAHFFGASSGVTWALSIVILVVLMRLIMVPLFIKQRNSMQKMQSHMPQLAENGINPLGGCLPLVAQLPVFWALFNVLRAIADWTPGHTPSYGLTVPVVESARQARIFGIALYDQFLHPAVGESSTSRYLIVVFVLVSAATTFLTMRQSQRRGMMNQTPADPDQPGAAAAQAMSKNMMYIAPFFALTGLYWQFGLVLYWVTTNIWTLGQQHFLFRSLPIVGSATVGASATQAASGNSGAAKSTASGTSAKTGTAAKTGTKSTSGAAKPAAKSSTSSSSAAAKAPVAKASANGSATANGAAANGSGLLRRFGKKEEPQDDVPVAPQGKVVRQQPVRQTRSKRGNTGKR